MPSVNRHTADPVFRVDPAERRGRLAGRGPRGDAPPRRGLLFFALAALLSLAALGAGGFAAWESGLKYRYVPKRWGVVVPGKIYRSGQLSRTVIEKQLADFGILEVIDLNGIEPEDRHQAYEIELMKRLGLPHHRFPLGGDGRGDIHRYADALETLVKAEQAGRPILVHCSAGAQRTGGVVACYRVLIQGKSTDDALREMQLYDFKPVRDEELIPYLNENIAELASLLVERGVIPRAPGPLPIFRP